MGERIKPDGWFVAGEICVLQLALALALVWHSQDLDGFFFGVTRWSVTCPAPQSNAHCSCNYLHVPNIVSV